MHIGSQAQVSVQACIPRTLAQCLNVVNGKLDITGIKSSFQLYIQHHYLVSA